MSQAPKAPPVRTLQHEVLDPHTGQVIGWINGDRNLQRALTKRGFRLVSGARSSARRSAGVLFAR